MRTLSSALLDLLQNAVEAEATEIGMAAIDSVAADRLTFRLADNGRGMEAEALARATDPAFTTRTTRRVGLGLAMVQATAERCGGGLQLTSRPGKGTRVGCSFGRSHLDRPPMGDLAGTLALFVATHPGLRFTLRYRTDHGTFGFDTARHPHLLSGLPLAAPRVAKALKVCLGEGLEAIEASY